MRRFTTVLLVVSMLAGCGKGSGQTAVNQPPTVSAGPDQIVTWPTNSVNLDGTVTDDGLPAPPGTVTTTWSKVSGPGTVAFVNASAVDTTATFSEAGVYVLRLTADDGLAQASDEVTITVVEFTKIAGGNTHTVALRSDGTVWAWGGNSFGQLGDNSTINRNTPVQVVGPGGSGYLTNITAIAGGEDHTVALKNDGTVVWAWGYNNSGQLGDGTTANKTTPVQTVWP